MIDAAGQALLQDIVRRESRSLLQYISEAFPWTTREERAALATLQGMIDEERRNAAALGQFLVRRKIGVPYLGPYPVSFTSMNYLSLDYLLPRLVEYQHRAIRQLQADLRTLSDMDATEQVERILNAKRRHLQILEGLAAEHAAAVALSPQGPSIKKPLEPATAAP